jgi:hypothetical protein
VTLCVGIERRGRVWVGADSSEHSGEATRAAAEPKVWRCNGWLVAGAGQWRAISVVRLAAKLPPAKGATEATVALHATAAIRAALRANEAPTVDGNADEDTLEAYGTDWLIGAPGVGLWCLDSIGDAHRVKEWAIGISEYAFGYLDACKLREPELRIRSCIEACGRRMPGVVRGPVTILEA